MRKWVVAAGLLVAGAMANVPVAQSGPPVPFTQAELFFELNHTDGDLGIHAAIDGGTWTALSVRAPSGHELLNIGSHGSLSAQGLTQLAFESAEPPFEELARGFLSPIPGG